MSHWPLARDWLSPFLYVAVLAATLPAVPAIDRGLRATPLGTHVLEWGAHYALAGCMALAVRLRRRLGWPAWLRLGFVTVLALVLLTAAGDNAVDRLHLPQYAILALLLLRPLSSRRRRAPLDEAAVAPSPSPSSGAAVPAGGTAANASASSRPVGRAVPADRRAALRAFAAAAVIGTLDELVQLAIPERVFDPWDIVLNAAGAALGLTIALAVGL